MTKKQHKSFKIHIFRFLQKNNLSLYYPDMDIKSFAHLFQNTADFPLRVSLQENQAPTPLHQHECVELVCVYDGEGTHLAGSGCSSLLRGDVFVIPRGFPHGYRVERKLSLFNVLFLPERLPMPQLDLCQMTGFQELFMPPDGEATYPFFHLDETQLDEILPLLRELLRETRNADPPSRTCRLGFLMVLLCRLTRFYCASRKKNDVIPDGINKVLEYMNKHFREEIPVESLPKMSRMSRSSFLRAFRKVTGSTPLQYQLHLRINYACRELQDTGDPVTSIAYRAGFTDSNYFTRAFHKIVGVTPREFRAHTFFS